MHRDITDAVRPRVDTPPRSLRHDHELTRTKLGSLAVDVDLARAVDDQHQHVGFVVDVLGCPLARSPGEERRVQILALEAPHRAAAPGRRDVEDPHAATLAASDAVPTFSP